MYMLFLSSLNVPRTRDLSFVYKIYRLFQTHRLHETATERTIRIPLKGHFKQRYNE